MVEREPVEFRLLRADDPWRGMTETWEQEQRNRHLAAVALPAPGLAPLPGLAGFTVAGEPLLARDDAGKRVVVNRRLFGDLTRADATRIAPSEAAPIGRCTDATFAALPPARLATFLLLARIVITYVHVESSFRLESEDDGPSRYEARYRGEHLYFTNHANRDPLAFAIRIDKGTGEMSLHGR